MAKVVCKKCPMTADSKCPFCRSVFGDDDTATKALDGVAGHRLRIGDDQIVVRLFKQEAGQPEDPAKVLSMLVNSVNRAAASDAVPVEEVCRIIACAHDWDFAPGAYSEIDCGHRAAPDPEFEVDKEQTATLAAMGWDPEEPCECGDKLKAHEDNLECACCPCGLFTPAKKEVSA